MLHTILNVDFRSTKHIQDREAASWAKARTTKMNNTIRTIMFSTYFINAATPI
uniref:Uncharacterized protein n=1 Tax=Arion vulgaris TaxID=1028688 RepID=A0A0B6Y9V7_9EUPU